MASPHFTLWTDASADRAREVVVEMEHLRQVIIGSSFRSVASEGSIFAIALRDLSEFHTYFSDQVLAFVHMIRALLAGNKQAGEDTRAAKRREVEVALRLDPTSVLANLVSTELDNKPTRDAARAVAAAHDDDWRAWWLLALVIESGDEAMVAARRACQLAAANPAVVPPPGLCGASTEQTDR